MSSTNAMTPSPAVLHGTRLAVVDVEGNGQQPPEIIEIAVLRIDDGAFTDPRPTTWLVRPRQLITPIVTRKVHGISNADVADAPAWAEVADDVARLLADRTLVAHHASVEHLVLSTHLPDWQPPTVLDTMRLAKHVWPGLPSYRLDTLIEHAALSDTNPATERAAEYRRHRAAYDTVMTSRLLLAVLAAAELTWPQLVDVCGLPRRDQPEQGGLW